MENNKIVNIDLSQFIDDGMAEYSKYVIYDRSLPDFRDGLKPSARRFMYSMYNLGLTSTSKHIKTQRVIGETLTYHPHAPEGPTTAGYNISKDYKINAPLVDIQGNNGGIDGSTCAATRYTEARPTKYADKYMLTDLEQEITTFKDNYDNTTKEPVFLPAKVPNLIINGTSGIAIGISTNIVPHNIVESVKLMKEIIENENISAKDATKILKGPDFPTGGVIANKDAVLEELSSGATKYIIRAKVNIICNKKEKYLEIVNIPYGMTTTSIIESLVDSLEPYLNIFKISDISDFTNINDVNIRIICKSSATIDDLKKLEQFLYQKTKLQCSISVQNRCIINGEQKLVGILEYLKEFVNFRLDILSRKFSFEKSKLEKTLNIKNGLKLAGEKDMLDKIINVAKTVKSAKMLSDRLVEFGFNEVQANYLSNLPLYRIGDLQHIDIDIQNLQKEIDHLQKLLSNDKLLKEELLKEVKNIIKDLENDPKNIRKTELMDLTNESVEKVVDTDLVVKKQVKVIMTKDLKICQMGVIAFDNQISNFDGEILFQDNCLNTDIVVGVSKTGNAYAIVVDKLPQITNLSQLDGVDPIFKVSKISSSDEFIGGIIAQNDNKAFLLTNNGYCKHIETPQLLKISKANGKTKSVIKFKTDDDFVVGFDYLKNNYFLNVTYTKTNNDVKGNYKPFVNTIKLKERSDTINSGGYKVINMKNKNFINYSLTESEV